MRYTIKSLDPFGAKPGSAGATDRDRAAQFVSAEWETPALPRIGEKVELAGGQDMIVEEVVHTKAGADVWLTGHDGWEIGSVVRLFEASGGGVDGSSREQVDVTGFECEEPSQLPGGRR